MGTYAQWRTAHDAGKLARVTWICGDQPVLIEEVIDAIKDKLKVAVTDYVSLSGSDETSVWAAANQYSLTRDANRMVLVRDADKLKRFEQLAQWGARCAAQPGVYLVFVSSEKDKKKQPNVIAELKTKARLVRCVEPNEDDALAWVRRRAPLDEPVARYLLERTGGNLSQAAAVCAKLALFDARAGTATINALADETPRNEFTDNLIAIDRRKAMLSLNQLAYGQQYFQIIGALESHLGTLEKIHRIQIAGRSWREATGVNPYLLRKFLPHSRHYSPADCDRRYRLLARISEALHAGNRIGPMEVLVALW